VLGSISDYIKEINQLIQHGNSKINVINKHKATFLISEMNRAMNEIRQVASCDVTCLDNEELKSRNGDLNKHSKTVASLPTKFKEYIELAPSNSTFDESNKEYEAIVKSWNTYQEALVKECKHKEIEKIESFNNIESFNKNKLNIKLPKFNGYDAPIDIYSFKTNFLKLYKHSVPTNLQADLLKNNHLEKDALMLVKNVTSIKEIWDRLKVAYGDTRILLANKISEL